MVPMVMGVPLEMLIGKRYGRASCCTGNAPYLDLGGSYTRVYIFKNSLSCCVLYYVFLTLQLKLGKKHRRCPQPACSPVWVTGSLHGVQRRDEPVGTGVVGQNEGTLKPQLDRFRVSFRRSLRATSTFIYYFQGPCQCVCTYMNLSLCMCVSDLSFYIPAPNTESLNERFLWHCYHPCCKYTRQLFSGSCFS